MHTKISLLNAVLELDPMTCYRAAWQASATDPTFPVALTIIYTVYKFFTKRKNRNPDGPFFGGSPFWAALGMTVLAFALGTVVSPFFVKPGSFYLQI